MFGVGTGAAPPVSLPPVTFIFFLRLLLLCDLDADQWMQGVRLLHAHHSTVHFAQILCCRLGLLLYGQRHRGQVVTLCFSEANSRRCACEQRSAARAIRTCRLGLLSRRYWWCGSYSFSDQSGAYNPTPRRRWKRSMKGVMRFKVVKDKI